jgi:hypothetical protein
VEAKENRRGCDRFEQTVRSGGWTKVMVSLIGEDRLKNKLGLMILKNGNLVKSKR